MSLAKKILSYLNPKNYDILGDNYKLKFGADENFKSIVGGLISLGVLGAIAASFFLSTMKLNSSESPNISISSDFSPIYPKFDLFEDKIFLIFGLVMRQVDIIPAEELKRYISVRGEVNQYKLNGGTTESIPLLYFDYFPCKELDQDFIKELYKDNPQDYALIYNFGICPNITKDDTYYVQSKVTSPPSVGCKIEIMPCSLPDPSECADSVEWGEIKYSWIYKGLNLSNFDKPFNNIPSFDRGVTITKYSSKNINIFLKKNIIKDDSRDFLPEVTRFEFSDIDSFNLDIMKRDETYVYCHEEDVKVLECDPYLHFHFSSSWKKVEIIRSYTKFIAYLAEMGGTSEIFMLFGLLIYSLFQWKFINEEVLTKGYIQIKNLVSTKDKKQREEYKKLALKNFENNKDGFAVNNKLNFISLLENAFMQEHHKKLLPLVILALESQSQDETSRSGKESTEDGDKDMSISQAYFKLKNSQAESPIDQILNKFFLSCLEDKRISGLLTEEDSLNKGNPIVSLKHPDFNKKSILYKPKKRRRKGSKIHRHKRTGRPRNNKINPSQKKSKAADEIEIINL